MSAATPEHSIRVITFALERQRFALHLAAVERVLPMVHVTPLPAAPPIVIGVINVQGTVIPVVSVRARFGLPGRPLSVVDHLVLARTSRRRLALAVDEVDGVLELRSEAVVPCAQAAPGVQYVEGLAKVDGDLILIHDLESFLSLDEESVLDRSLAQ